MPATSPDPEHVDGRRGRRSRLKLVGAAGFEPTTLSSRTIRATKLRHAPTEMPVVAGRGHDSRGVFAARSPRLGDASGDRVLADRDDGEGGEHERDGHHDEDDGQTGDVAEAVRDAPVHERPERANPEREGE